MADMSIVTSFFFTPPTYTRTLQNFKINGVRRTSLHVAWAFAHDVKGNPLDVRRPWDFPFGLGLFTTD